MVREEELGSSFPHPREDASLAPLRPASRSAVTSSVFQREVHEGGWRAHAIHATGNSYSAAAE